LISLAMILAVIGGATALTLVLRGPAPPPQYAASAPPLAIGSAGVTAAATPAGPTATPLTVRLRVPSAGIDIAAAQGDGVTVPLHLALHYPGTDQPGGGSNALYYAHAQPGMFQALYNVHPGDEIDAVRTDGSVIRYKAAAFKKVSWNDRTVLAPTPFEQLTLLTCTSYDPYTPRFIVIGLPA
jgi:LPXTG-site transpeptidase (sortase) family protein